MIKQIQIKNLKSIHQSAPLNMVQLNLFTGVNGGGKSTFLQALLLLRQSYFNGNFFRRPATLWLGNAPESLINVGTFSDIYHQNAKKSEGISLGFTEDVYSFSFLTRPYEAGNTQNAIEGILKSENDSWQNCKLFQSQGFQYLSADRITPQEDYPRFQDNELLGKDGRFTAHYLEKYGSKPLAIEQLMHEKSDTKYDNSLISQVNLWMRDISPNILIKAKENLSTNRVELSYSYFDAKGVPTKDRKPQNVGFGITPTLPILVALLSASPGDLVLIENPEIHIHPKGQSRLGMLMAKAAQGGVQLLVETHSDHILNGIRVATKKGWIDSENINISYFTRSVDEVTTITSLKIDQKGRIDQWPSGFFDEWDNMLDELL